MEAKLRKKREVMNLGRCRHRESGWEEWGPFRDRDKADLATPPPLRLPHPPHGPLHRPPLPTTLPPAEPGFQTAVLLRRKKSLLSHI